MYIQYELCNQWYTWLIMSFSFKHTHLLKVFDFKRKLLKISLSCKILTAYTYKSRNCASTARSLGPAEGVFLENWLSPSDHIINIDSPAIPIQLFVGLATKLPDKYMLCQLHLESHIAGFIFWSKLWEFCSRKHQSYLHFLEKIWKN